MPTRTRSVRIVSDGNTGRNTHVYDGETGEELSGFVDRVEVTLDANEVTRASVRLLFPSVDILTEAAIDNRVIDMNDRHELERVIDILYRRVYELKRRQ
jgi:hypothetical protein